MLSHWAYILIGQNNTGKTTFQRNIVRDLCGKSYKKLPRNLHAQIVHDRAQRRLDTLFAMNRSFQEMHDQFKTVSAFFARGFKDADVCFLSSHADTASIADVQQMIEHLHQRCYNVGAIFFSNGFDNKAPQISCLPWQERFWIENPFQSDESKISAQLESAAKDFGNLVLVRAPAQ